MSLNDSQRRWRERNRESLLEKNKLRMRERRADPAQRSMMSKGKRDWYFRTKYGLELEDIQQMWEERGGKCDLCECVKPAPHHEGPAYHKLVIDHCHDTERIRGMLCYKCNTALGQLGDTAEAIDRVLNYVL